MKKRGGSWFMSFFKSKETEPTVQTNPLAVKPADVNTLPKPVNPAEVKPTENSAENKTPVTNPVSKTFGGSRRRKTRRRTRPKKSRRKH